MQAHVDFIQRLSWFISCKSRQNSRGLLDPSSSFFAIFCWFVALPCCFHARILIFLWIIKAIALRQLASLAKVEVPTGTCIFMAEVSLQTANWMFPHWWWRKTIVKSNSKWHIFWLPARFGVFFFFTILVYAAFCTKKIAAASAVFEQRILTNVDRDCSDVCSSHLELASHCVTRGSSCNGADEFSDCGARRSWWAPFGVQRAAGQETQRCHASSIGTSRLVSVPPFDLVDFGYIWFNMYIYVHDIEGRSSHAEILSFELRQLLASLRRQRLRKRSRRLLAKVRALGHMLLGFSGSYQCSSGCRRDVNSGYSRIYINMKWLTFAESSD